MQKLLPRQSTYLREAYPFDEKQNTKTFPPNCKSESMIANLSKNELIANGQTNPAECVQRYRVYDGSDERNRLTEQTKNSLLELH